MLGSERNRKSLHLWVSLSILIRKKHREELVKRRRQIQQFGLEQSAFYISTARSINNIPYEQVIHAVSKALQQLQSAIEPNEKQKTLVISKTHKNSILNFLSGKKNKKNLFQNSKKILQKKSFVKRKCIAKR